MTGCVGAWPETFMNLLLGMLAAGIYASSFLPLPFWPLLVLSAAAFLAAAFFWQRRSGRTWLAIAVLFLLVGVLRGGAANVLPATDIARHVGETGEVTGVLRTAPSVTEDAAGVYHVRYEVEAVSFRDSTGRIQSASGGLYIYDRRPEGTTMPPALPGDKLWAVGKVQPL